MLEVAEIFRLHGPAYREKFGHRMLPSHRRAMQDIETCRTESLGGQVYFCKQCQAQRYSYHSCKNRHCPKCQNEQANDWLAAQQSLLLPVTHFLVTFTLPAELRVLARSHQKTIYNLLFRASAAALLQLAQDPRFVGGTPWHGRRAPHLDPPAALSSARPLHRHRRRPHCRRSLALFTHRLSRARQSALTNLPRQVSRCLEKDGTVCSSRGPRSGSKDWVVHSEPVGSGEQAFQYLAPYIFRVAISNNRLRNWMTAQVTFTYKESATDQLKPCTITAEEFIRRFLQHVLPSRFIKVRYYGLLSPAHRQLLLQARQLLSVTISKLKTEAVKTTKPLAPLSCPHCGGPLTLLSPLAPRGRAP